MPEIKKITVGNALKYYAALTALSKWGVEEFKEINGRLVPLRYMPKKDTLKGQSSWWAGKNKRRLQGIIDNYDTQINDYITRNGIENKATKAKEITGTLLIDYVAFKEKTEKVEEKVSEIENIDKKDIPDRIPSDIYLCLADFCLTENGARIK